MKAILVIDMPSNYCQDCSLRRGLFCGENGNSLYDYIHNDSLNDKPNWCPLKPLPKYVKDKNTFAIENKYMNYQDGYNACLDVILEGKQK